MLQHCKIVDAELSSEGIYCILVHAEGPPQHEAALSWVQDGLDRGWLTFSLAGGQGSSVVNVNASVLGLRKGTVSFRSIKYYAAKLAGNNYLGIKYRDQKCVVKTVQVITTSKSLQRNTER